MIFRAYPGRTKEVATIRGLTFDFFHIYVNHRDDPTEEFKAGCLAAILRNWNISPESVSIEIEQKEV